VVLATDGEETCDNSPNGSNYYGTNGTVMWRPQDTHEYTASLDKIQGAHSMRFGAQYRKYMKNQINPDISSTGQVAFAETYTRGPLDNSPNAPRGPGRGTASCHPGRSRVESP